MNTQLILPGTPLRISANAVWESSTRPCTVQVVVDTPSDLYASQIDGLSTTGLFTFEELGSVMETMVCATFETYRRMVGTVEAPDA